MRMERKRISSTAIQSLLKSEQVRRYEQCGEVLYSAADIIAVMNDADSQAETWAQVREREPALAKLVQIVPVEGQEAVDTLDVPGVMRLIQAMHTPRAEKLKAWLAATAAEWLDEDENPELAALRARRLYESRGFHRRWVAKRLRGADARHEATAEWYKRGVTESDQYRALTNAIIEGAFGMDVASFRRLKGLTRPGQSLRDHMTDLELALTELGETLAVSLHRARGSRGFEALERDARDAGRIVARTRDEIEHRLDHSVVEAA
jgi:DNA-damage-inducible protein D